MVKLQLDVGAKTTILVSHMHPKDVISRAYPNYVKMEKIEGLVVVLETSKPIHHEEKVVVVFHHPPKGDWTEEFDCWVLHQFVHVTEEGPEEGLFSALNGGGDTNSGSEQATQPAPNNTEDPQKNQENIPTEVVTILDSAGATINDSDVELLRKMVPGMVDNDNQPLPENMPTEEEQNAPSQPQFFMAWEHSGSCFHCLEGGHKTKACINFNTDVKPTVEQLFEVFFFKPFIMGTIILQMNKCLKENRHCPLAYGEFLHWLSLWFLMATINGPDKVEFWSMGEVDYFVGAPMRLGSYMSRKHFESILKVLSISSQERPAFLDHFWEVCEILKAWNSSMVEQFTPSWVSCCLDESMSTWTNKYSCPGWMFVP